MFTFAIQILTLNNYSKIFFIILLAISCNVAVFAAVTFTKQAQNTQISNKPIYNSTINLINSDLYYNFKNIFFKNSAIDFSINNFKSTGLIATDNQKNIDNVKIFPNPVSTQVNISFILKKEEKVSIKIWDILGKEVILLLDKKLAQGEHNNTFYINAKIPSGFYFVRIVSDSDTVTKRISVI